MKRAAIYVRVSTQEQAERVSPQEQENDCRAYCKRNGYAVEEVYRDTEKYRVNGRMVEPSGTRSDRPAFLRMLRDFDDDKFDVLVAWREDRLYRGVNRAVIELKERVKSGGLHIEIFNGGFNPQTMEVLAWAAGVENEARLERTMMGTAARLREGKFALAVPPYGYDSDSKNSTLTINEEEAHWVRMIYQWYGEGLGRTEIRRRLVEADAPQKQTTAAKNKRKRPWSFVVINKILHRDDYFTGIWEQKWGKVEGTNKAKIFQFAIPPIIDAKLYEAVKERRAQYKRYPAGNLRSQSLLAGIVYCQQCGCLMSAKKRTVGSKYSYLYYQCNSGQREGSPSGCAKYVKQVDADWLVWGTLWEILCEPGRFELAIEERIAQLKLEEGDAKAEVARIERQLDDLMMRRQYAIKLALDGTITQDDLETQLMPLSMAEKSLKRELQDKQLLVGDGAQRFIDLANHFRQQVQSQLAALHPDHYLTPAVDEEQAREQFSIKRHYIEGLVKRVEITGDKNYHIFFEFGMWAEPNIAEQDNSLLIGYISPQAHINEVQKFSFVIEHAATDIEPHAGK